MVNIQFVEINESTILTDDKVHEDFAPAWNEHSEHILCYYINGTSLVQIARIANISNCYFERVVFPRERLLFEALPDAELEIHTGIRGSAILSAKIKCDRLRVFLR